MPTYTFRNTVTEEEFEDFMSFSAYEAFLSANPHIQRTYNSAPAIVSGMPMSGPKIDSGFKDVLSRVADANPHSPLASQYGDKGIRASKTRDAVDREKKRQQSKTS